MKLLYGTANPAKLSYMREILNDLNLEIIGLKDIAVHPGHIDESGNDPLENARIKALEYYKHAGIPVFSCDSGLYIEGLSHESQPGVHVRRVNGRTLNDEEMIEHYAKLAEGLGGQAKARYKNAICLVLNHENIFEYDGDDISSVPFLITHKPHQNRVKGFPLDSISMNIKTGKYYMDMDADSFTSEMVKGKGFIEFFMRTVAK